MKAALRVLAFIGKEIQAIVTQPQLLLLLVLGPFLVLLAFGLGYKPLGPDLRTIVVQPTPDDPKQAIGAYLGAIGPPIRVVQVEADLSPALARLQAQHVDLVVVVPTGIRDTLLAGQNVHLVFYHNAIDPQRIGYITAVIDGATAQLNKAIVEQTVGEQQASAADYEKVLTDLRSALGGIHDALQQNDRARARQLSQVVRLNSGLVASLWLFAATPFTDPSTPAIQLVEEGRQLDALLAAPDSQPQALDDAITRMQADVDRMLAALDRAQKVPPAVFVSPLVWEAKGISAYQPGYVAFHSPTVLALLVQHLCITLAALSLVDERTAGAIELFRAAPIGPSEVLAGKFLAYLLLVALTSVGLVAVIVYGLHVPLLGDWRWLTAVLAALMAYSLNLGFLFSALAKSRSQAIQMSMLALLGSIFFSGFFVPLEDFGLPVRLISYSLPVTYGIEELRQVVLRGEPPEPVFLGIMVIWALVLGFISVRLFRRIFLYR